jgi:hypothetical protein
MVSSKLSIVGALVFAFASITSAQSVVPLGTILPIALSSTVSANSKPGGIISGRVMQDVQLPAGKIHRGTHLTGHVIAVVPAQGSAGAEVSIAFDALALGKRAIPITTGLRAMASFVDVDAAQIPTTGPDRGTPQNDWTTQLIGGDVDYRAGGLVTEGASFVGRPVYGGVLSKVNANASGQCRGAIEGDAEPQALWVFSSNACGLYGFPGVTIAHAGRDNPVGKITLRSNSGKLKLPSGTGLLLRVIGAGETTPQVHG